jgi:hypothetical protein
MKLRYLLLALALIPASAHALDRNETSFVRVTTGLLFLTMMCHDYQPLSDVLNYLGKQSIGQDRTKKLFLAVGSAVTQRLRDGGMKLGPGGEPETLDPEVSKIVDEIMSNLLDLYHDDKAKTCRTVGDLSVKNGVAEKVR